MKMGKSKWHLRAAGYLAFAVFAFLLSLYLTFDYSKLKPIIKSRLEEATGARVEIGSLSSYRISGIDIKNLKMKFSREEAKEGEQPQGPATLTIENLKLRLKLLPLVLGRRSISFDVLAAGGRLEGGFSSNKTGVRLNARLSNLTLDRVPLDPLVREGFRLGGKMDGRIDLDVPDTNDPTGWGGELDIELKAAKIFPFTYMGVDIPEIPFSAGKVLVKIDQGKADIDPVKLDSKDLPVDLKGTLELRNPWPKSFMNIEGTIKPGSDFQKSVPFITSAFSPTQPFTYKGNLDALLKTF